MSAEQARGYESFHVNKGDREEIKIDSMFSIDLASFLKNQKKEEIKNRILKEYDEMHEPIPDSFELTSMVDAEINEMNFDSHDGILNLKKLLDDKEVLDIGNGTMHLLFKGSAPFVSYNQEGSEPIDMGLMEFLKRLNNTKAFSIEQIQELFDTTVTKHLHPDTI